MNSQEGEPNPNPTSIALYSASDERQLANTMSTMSKLNHREKGLPLPIGLEPAIRCNTYLLS